jgi:hypothetical protein
MFFVLSGRPVFRNQHGQEELAPGDFVFCPEGRAGLHTFSNPTEEPAQILAISAGGFPSYSREAATPASSLASRSRSSRSFGRFPAVARHDEEATRAASSLAYKGSRRGSKRIRARRYHGRIRNYGPDGRQDARSR